MYRIASALQEQKYSGTDSVNARAERLRRRHESSLSAGQQSRCHPVRTAFLIIREESLPSSALRGPRAAGVQGFAETTPTTLICNSLIPPSCHGFSCLCPASFQVSRRI